MFSRDIWTLEKGRIKKFLQRNDAAMDEGIQGVSIWCLRKVMKIPLTPQTSNQKSLTVMFLIGMQPVSVQLALTLVVTWQQSNSPERHCYNRVRVPGEALLIEGDDHLGTFDVGLFGRDQ
ncbi:hypothetical protein INR49_028273, partial [Caranx melampygus]